MKSGSSGHRDDDEADEDLEGVQELPRPAKGETPVGEVDDFDEDDFDDEFDDDFEEELEDEYDLSEFADVTEEDLAEGEETDVTALGDFVDEDAEPEEPPVVEAEEAEAKDAKGKGGKEGKEAGKKSKPKKKSKDED